MLKLNNLDQVVRLRNHRERALELRQQAHSGYFDPIINAGGDQQIRVATVISIDSLRQAIEDACNKNIAAYDAELAELGVAP